MLPGGGGSQSEGRPGVGRPVGYLAEDPAVTGNIDSELFK